MKYIRKLIIIVMGILVPVLLLAQPASMRGSTDREIGIPYFHLDAVTLLSDDPSTTKLMVYIEIVYDNLQFLRSPRGFEAKYEVDLSLLAGREKDAPRVLNRLERRNVISHDYQETNARNRYDVAVIDLEVQSGTYTLVATLKDLESKLKSEARKTVNVPSYQVNGLLLGDLLLAKKVKVADDGFYEIVPNVNRTIQNSNLPGYVYYEVYPDDSDSLDVYARILNQNGAIVREKSFILEASSPITRDYIQFDPKNLSYGQYVIELQVKSDLGQVLKGTSFRIQMAGMPSSINDLGEAIRQLRYIGTTKQIKEIVNANPLKQGDLFRDFWKQRDPTPETQVNELMEEYYLRIVQANEMFGTFREGWETDRGEVYVRFGPPSEIERHPFDINSRPYEIWYYYELKLEYIFVDEMGYGEYRRVNSLWQ